MALTAVLAVIAVTLAMVTVTGARAEAAEPTDFEPNYDMGLESVRNSGDDSWGPLVWAGTPPEGNSTGNAANDVGWGWCIDYTQADPMHKGGSYKKSTAGALSFDDPKYQDAVIGLALKLRDAQENGQKQLAKKYIVYLSAIISDPSGREAAINFINGNLGYGDANNVSRFQGFEGSPQEFTELTGLRIVKTTAQNLDDLFDVDPSVKVDKQPADAFLTIVGPNGIYKHTSGGGQRVLPPDQPGLPDDDGGEDRNPEISTQAEFAGDADQVVAGAKVTDTVEYKDLVPGKKYTLNAELVNKADKSVVGKGEKTFTPQESAGKVDVEITVDSDVTEPVEAAVAFEELTSTEVDAKGEETPDAEKPNKVAEHKDIDDADQTVTSKKDEKPEKDNKPSETSTPMTSTSSSKPSTSESKSSEPKKETTSESKPSEPSETKTSSSKTSANAKPSTSTSSEKSKEPRPTEVQGQEPGDSPEPKITTDADFAEGSHVVVAGAKIVDEVSYEGLVPGKEYTLKAELISKKDEKTVLGTGEKTFTPEKSAGKVDVEITVHDDVTEPVEAAVAFEELTSVEVDAKGEETPDVTPEKPNHIAEHKDINDDDQTVTSKKDEKPESKPKEKAEGQSERPSVKVKEQDAPAQADKGTGKVEQHVDITNHVPGKTGKPLPSDAKRTEIKSVPSGATELEPGMQTYIK